MGDLVVRNGNQKRQPEAAIEAATGNGKRWKNEKKEKAGGEQVKG
jgi:hypothetical protein